MRRGAVRVALVLVWAAGIAALTVETLRIARARDALAEARAAFDEDAWRATLAIADLDAAQRAAVATGQPAQFWLSRAAEARRAVAAALAKLQAEATAPDARRSLEQAAALLRDFDGLDRRAREYLALDQALLASDLIFADGRDLLRATARHLDAARAAERSSAEAGLGALARRHAWVAGGGGAWTLLVILLLLPAGQPPTSAARAAAVTSVDTAPPAEATVADPEIGAALDARLDGRAAPSSPARAETPPVVDWAAAAALCRELAQVADTRDLSTLLARAAHILGAKGVVLWVTDPSAAQLVPAIAHGYPPDTVARIGPVARDADNATAVAYRSTRTQVVAGSPGTTGALIAPLVTVSGCAGVMAAELAHPREQDEATRAAAEILAAQLATLVAPSSPPASAAATTSTSASA